MAAVMQASALPRRPVSCGLPGQLQGRPASALTPAQARTASGNRLGGSPPSTTTGISRAAGQTPLDYSPAARGLQGFPGQLAGGYPGVKATHSPAVHNGTKSVHSPASTATTTTPNSSLSGRNSTPSRQDPLSSGRGMVSQRIAWNGQDKPADHRMGQAPVPNQLQFDPPAGTGSRSGLEAPAAGSRRLPQQAPPAAASTDLSSAAAPNLHRVNGGADQLSGRDNRPGATGLEWSRERAGGGTAARPLRGPRSPVREPPMHARGQFQPQGMAPPKVQQPSGQTQAGQQLQPQGMSPPKVQQPNGQTQAGNSVANEFQELIISAQMQCSRHGLPPSVRGNCQDAPFAPRALLQGRDLNDPKQSAQNGGKEEPMMDKLQDANKKWFCEQEHSEELLSACANFMHLTLMPDPRTREHSLNAVRTFVDNTMTKCQYHNVHLVLALIYLQRYHESKSFKSAADIDSDHIRDPWKALQKDLHVALHLAECWYPMDNDAPLKGTHVVRQSGLLGEVGEDKFPHSDKKKGLYWEQWVICKALDWRFYVTREEFVQFGERVHKDKATKEAQNMIAKQSRGGLQRGGMQINQRGQARSMPATLNRGLNSRSDPTVQTCPRNELLSPKGNHGEDGRPSDKASDEGQDQTGESLGPQFGVAPGRPSNHPGPCQAPRPCQPGQSKLPSRATVGGAPLPSDMRRPEPVGNRNVGGRPGQLYGGLRGREPGENGKSNITSRIPQPTPFSGGVPPPVSSRGAGPRLDTTCPPNSGRPSATAGPMSALDSSRGAQLRSSTDPGSRSGPQPSTAQGMSATAAGGHPRTPPNSSNSTPRPHAFTGSLGASRPGAAAPQTSLSRPGAAAPQTGFSPYANYGSSPSRSAGITVNRGNPVQVRR